MERQCVSVYACIVCTICILYIITYSPSNTEYLSLSVSFYQRWNIRDTGVDVGDISHHNHPPQRKHFFSRKTFLHPKYIPYDHPLTGCQNNSISVKSHLCHNFYKSSTCRQKSLHVLPCCIPAVFFAKIMSIGNLQTHLLSTNSLPDSWI